MSRRYAEILSQLPRIRPHAVLRISHPRLQPRRHVLLAPSHGFHRESQLLHELQAYVLPPPRSPMWVSMQEPDRPFLIWHWRDTGPTPRFPLFLPICHVVLSSRRMLNWNDETNMNSACSTCSGGPAKRRCSRCKAAFYCDRSCQKTDWKTHRNVCEPAQQTASAPGTPNFSNPASPTSES
jgi:hypothetical protein